MANDKAVLAVAASCAKHEDQLRALAAACNERHEASPPGPAADRLLREHIDLERVADDLHAVIDRVADRWRANRYPRPSGNETGAEWRARVRGALDL